jgi:hypothetical protein
MELINHKNANIFVNFKLFIIEIDQIRFFLTDNSFATFFVHIGHLYYVLSELLLFLVH